MEIRIINPVITGDFLIESEQEFAGLTRPDTMLSHVILEQGPASIESAASAEAFQPFSQGQSFNPVFFPGAVKL